MNNTIENVLKKLTASIRDVTLTIKKDHLTTILIPVFEEPELVANFVNNNKDLLTRHQVFVIDRKGGNSLQEYAQFYRKTNCPLIGWPLGRSRRYLIRLVQTEFTLNLDADVVVPKQFINESLKKFKDPKVAVVALNYEKPQSHLAFGPSIWRTDVLKKLYDYNSLKSRPCECVYIWNKVHEADLKIETLNMRAKHLKSLGDFIKRSKAGFYYYAWDILLHLRAVIVS